MDQITAAAKEELGPLRKIKIFSIWASTIILPITEAIIISLHDKLNLVSPILFWGVLVGIVFIHILFASVSVQGAKLVQEVYFSARDIFDENSNLKSERDSLRESIRYLMILNESVLAWRIMLRRYKEINYDENEVVQGVLDEILSIVVEKRDEVFGFRSGELWNFAVYICDGESKELKPVWRSMHANHPAKGLGRSWGIGDGHVGRAFQTCEAKITSDATDPQVADAFRPHKVKIKEYDQSAYRSFASIPIGPVRETEAPIGVLVATSNATDRFNKGNCLILRHAAAVLANLIHINGLDKQLLLALNAQEA